MGYGQFMNQSTIQFIIPSSNNMILQAFFIPQYVTWYQRIKSTTSKSYGLESHHSILSSPQLYHWQDEEACVLSILGLYSPKYSVIHSTSPCYIHMNAWSLSNSCIFCVGENSGYRLVYFHWFLLYTAGLFFLVTGKFYQSLGSL